MRSALRPILFRDANLVTNGSFDSDAAGWTLAQTGIAPTFTSVAGVGRITLNASGHAVYAQTIRTVIGRTYRATGRLPGTTGTVSVYLFRKSDDAVPTLNVVTLKSGTGAVDTSFTATAAVTYLTCQVNASTAATGDYDDLRVVAL
jgi:hypothetical protein